ncbi:MAG: hypothetical protein NT159_04625 [Proteobacteria bacterium]|nr:hypothetical protein [Pseudomonadota bacterium]
MAINSVSSSTSADALSVSAKAQPDRTIQSDRSKNQAPAVQAGQAAATTATAQVEAPRPVVNTQGQTTGRIINTQA